MRELDNGGDDLKKSAKWDKIGIISSTKREAERGFLNGKRKKVSEAPKCK